MRRRLISSILVCLALLWTGCLDNSSGVLAEGDESDPNDAPVTFLPFEGNRTIPRTVAPCAVVCIGIGEPPIDEFLLTPDSGALYALNLSLSWEATSQFSRTLGVRIYHWMENVDGGGGELIAEGMSESPLQFQARDLEIPMNSTSRLMVSVYVPPQTIVEPFAMMASLEQPYSYSAELEMQLPEETAGK